MKNAILKLWDRIKNGREGSNPTQGQSMIRILAGGYLVYLAVKIIMDLPNQNLVPWKMALMIAFVVLFVVVGIIFALIGIFALKRQMDSTDASEMNTSESEEDTKAIEEEKSEEKEETDLDE